jgi:hypothetical protein
MFVLLAFVTFPRGDGQMPSITLAAYTLKARVKGKRDLQRLSNFGDDGHDLHAILAEYLNELRANPTLDEANKKLLEVVSLNQRNRELKGVIHHGEWGYPTQGKNVRTLRVSYTRSQEDVEPFPFYYLISMPEHARVGVVILQRFGHLGIRQQLLGYFQRRFAEDYPDFSVNIAPAAPGDLVDQVTGTGATVRALRFVQHRLPRNLEDRYPNVQEAMKEAYAEYVIYAKRTSRGLRGLMPLVRGAIRDRGGVQRLTEIADTQADRIKVAVKYGGRTRTLELAETLKMRAYYDITNRVRLNNDGLPTYRSVNQLAHALLREQYNELGGQP